MCISSPLRAQHNGFEAGWDAIRHKLSTEQQKPMDELLEDFEGLHEVKRIALSAYIDVLADKKLKDKGHEKSVTPRTLNFAFMGNPGTYYIC